MRVLHVVKTVDGGPWAAAQVAELTRLGVEVHVALPSAQGLYMGDWARSGATIHSASLDLPVRCPWLLGDRFRSARRLVDQVAPDLIHSHFVGTTLLLRYALGKDHPIPRVFQIPGPLHLEHTFPRSVELSSAGKSDYWICTSKYIERQLERQGILPGRRSFFSYYGWPLTDSGVERTCVLRDMLGIQKHELVVGNISWFYPPKRYLGQEVGLKCHEDLIEALALVIRQRKDVVGLLAGGGYLEAKWYEERLRAMAMRAAGDRIKMPGILPPTIVRQCWPDFDCAIHVPLSENCGGVMEPLLAHVPTIAGRVGGLPEVVVDGITGKTVSVRQPTELAAAIFEVLDDLEKYRVMAARGRSRVLKMFDVRRTAREVQQIYGCILGESVAPAGMVELAHSSDAAAD